MSKYLVCVYGEVGELIENRRGSKNGFPGEAGLCILERLRMLKEDNMLSAEYILNALAAPEFGLERYDLYKMHDMIPEPEKWEYAISMQTRTFYVFSRSENILSFVCVGAFNLDALPDNHTFLKICTKRPHADPKMTAPADKEVLCPRISYDEIEKITITNTKEHIVDGVKIFSRDIEIETPGGKHAIHLSSLNKSGMVVRFGKPRPNEEIKP